MRVVLIDGFGPPDVLRVGERPRPIPGPGEVLVDVAAAGVNRPDLMQRAGKYPPPPGVTDVPGLEVAGRISALGDGVPRSASGRVWAVGDRVLALVAGGGYAEQCAVPGVQCLPTPDSLSDIEAAAVAETYFTVWTNVFERGRLEPGEWLLVHGGTSGIGTTAIQLAKARGAHVLATAGTDEKCQACRDLGADNAVNYRTADFVEAVKVATSGRGVDVILDMVGADYLVRNLDALTTEGRIVQIAVMSGAHATVPLHKIMAKRATLTGSTLRPRSVAEKGQIAAALEREVWPLLVERRVHPIIANTFPLENAAAAHALLEAGEVIRKLVLVV